jgi:hypothetical protein
MTSALSHGRPGQHHRLVVADAVDDLTQRQDRRVHILRHHVRVAAVEPVVEVAPHPTVPHGAGDHTGQQRHADGNEESAGLGHQCEIVSPVAEHLVDDGSDVTDRVAHGEATADVDDPSRHIERLADVDDEGEGAAQGFSVRLGVGGVGAELRRQIRRRRSRVRLAITE